LILQVSSFGVPVGLQNLAPLRVARARENLRPNC
jgi:hypothetical protein